MKGNISIGDFIHQVKQELVAAQTRDSREAFYALEEVTLEISFVLDTTGKAGFNLHVVELGKEFKAQQTHKVTLKLVPLAETDDSAIAHTRTDQVANSTRVPVPATTAEGSNSLTTMPRRGGGGGRGAKYR